MENEILEKIKKDYKDMMTIAGGDYSEIEELKKHPAVQRYLQLVKLQDNPSIIRAGMSEYFEREILGEIIGKYGYGKIKETNHIWFLYYEAVKDGEEILVYVDIEDKSQRIVIKKEDRDEFERTHIVIYGNSNICSGEDRYYNIREMFFGNCLTEGQEVAVQKLLSIYRVNR